MTTERAPSVCQHHFAEHTSRYDLRCTRCGQSSLDVRESDRRMILVWAEWAKQSGNDGAAELFARVAFAPNDLRAMRTAINAVRWALVQTPDDPAQRVLRDAIKAALAGAPEANRNTGEPND